MLPIKFITAARFTTAVLPRAPRIRFALLAAALGLLPLSARADFIQTTIQPSLGVNYQVITTSTVPADLGMIDMFGGDFAPDAFANGNLFPASTYGPLFTALGTTYGGDATAFAIPNLNGRTIIGAGQGTGLTNRNLGDTTGVPQLTLNNTQYPASVGGGGQPFTNMQPSLALNYYISALGIFPSDSSNANGGSNQQPFIGQVIATANTNPGFAPNSWLPADGSLVSKTQYPGLFTLIGTTYGGDGVTTFALPDLRGRTVIGAGNGAGLSSRIIGDAPGAESTTLGIPNLPAPDGTHASYSNMQPSLALNYIISLTGIFPVRDGDQGFDASSPFLGQIILFAGDFAPGGWAFCNGQILQINQNLALFALLGTTYGGDGDVTFGLPDLQGRTGVGQDNGATWTLAEDAGVEDLFLPTDPSAVPEPASLALLSLSGLALLARRRRSSCS